LNKRFDINKWHQIRGVLLNPKKYIYILYKGFNINKWRQDLSHYYLNVK